MPFICSICGEESTRICARCTKDACDNHLCEKCLRCSDCCECEVSLSEPVRAVVHPVAQEPVPVPVAQPPAAELEPGGSDPLGRDPEGQDHPEPELEAEPAVAEPEAPLAEPEPEAEPAQPWTPTPPLDT